MNNKKQIQITLDEGAINILDELKNGSGVNSYTDVIRDSLGFYYWAYKKQKNNLSFTVVNENGDLIEVFDVFKF